MKRWLSYVITIVVFATCSLGSAAGQKQPRPGTVVIPPTSVEHPENIGKRAHTNFLIFVPAAKKGGAQPESVGTTPSGETPGSLACVYQTVPSDSTSCPISASTTLPSGGSKVIAIVDAYDYPTACNDFNVFSNQFGLPTADCTNPNDPHFRVVYATGSQPAANCGWAQEEAIDIEWAHAMAPNAQIILVEAASNSYSDLLTAVDVASNLVANAGGGQVSMSWGGSEFSTESTLDSYFTGKGVTYFASSGDNGGKVIWPSASPNVVSAGGTSVNRDSNGNFTGESTWSDAGGGASRMEPVPDYQSAIYTLAQLLGRHRGTPDLSFDADPYTGVSVYDSTPCQGYSGWMIFGGTSVSAPSLAGIVNLSGAFDGGWDNGTNDASVQDNLYNNYSNASSAGTVCNYGQTSSAPFYDVTSGSAGRYSATGCWDFANGIGSGRGLSGPTASTTAGFSLSASPSSLSMMQGSSKTATVTVNPSSGYSDPVNLDVTSALPSGVTVSFSQNPTSSSSNWASTVTVTADATAQTGSFSLTIVGTDANDTSITAQTSIAVTVTQSSSGGGFTISASSSTLSVSKGGSTTGTVIVTSSGFSGSVSLSVSGLPKFAIGNFSPNPVSVSADGTTSSTLTVKTNKKVAAGSYPLMIIGTSGSLSSSTAVTLNVQ